jgi:hypothetical protein
MEPLFDFRKARFHGGEALAEHDVVQFRFLELDVSGLGKAIESPEHLGLAVSECLKELVLQILQVVLGSGKDLVS